MEDTGTFVNWQFGMTLIVGLALAVWLLVRVQRQRHRRGEEGHVSTPTRERMAKASERSASEGATGKGAE